MEDGPRGVVVLPTATEVTVTEHATNLLPLTEGRHVRELTNNVATLINAQRSALKQTGGPALTGGTAGQTVPIRTPILMVYSAMIMVATTTVYTALKKGDAASEVSHMGVTEPLVVMATGTTRLIAVTLGTCVHMDIFFKDSTDRAIIGCIISRRANVVNRYQPHLHMDIVMITMLVLHLTERAPQNVIVVTSW